MRILWFLLMIGPLVFFHELGHFLAARRFGVKCEHFAIGVGPRVASFRRGETEFSIRALPLGGFVSMLGAVADDAIPEADQGKALTDKPVWQRMIIYLAGPVANVVIALPIFWMGHMGTAMVEGPEIGMVLDGSPAQTAGLLPGDRIVEIDGRPIRYFDQVRRRASRSPGTTLHMVIERDGERIEIDATPRSVRAPDRVGLRTTERGQLGIIWSRYPSVVHVDAQSDAYAAGLRTFDRITAVDGRPVEAWLDLESMLGDTTGPVRLSVTRLVSTDDRFATLSIPSAMEVVIPPGGSGIHSAQGSVFGLQPESPAAAAGLMSGDRVISADGAPVTSLAILDQSMAYDPGQTHTLLVDRGGNAVTVTIEPLTMDVVGEFRSTHEQTFVGLIPMPSANVPFDLVRMGAVERLFRATVQAFVSTGEYLVGIFLGVLLLVIGAVDSSNLGGPLMIADVAYRAGSQGLLPFLRFMAVISINLGIVNLLPVPGLDGGHLMLLTAEGIRRKPLSFRARQIASYVGLVCLVLLMLFAFKNDVERYWVDLANWLNS